MLTFINSKTSRLLNPRFFVKSFQQKQHWIGSMRMQGWFGNKKSRRVKELSATAISLEDVEEKIVEEVIDYENLSSEMRKIQWQKLPFDELCAIDPKILRFIELDIKKDKFNVSDSEFYFPTAPSTPIPHSQPYLQFNQNAQAYLKLNRYYQKIYSLLIGNQPQYDSLRLKPQKWDQTAYLHQFMVLDLHTNKELLETIRIFVANVSQTRKLEGIAEPTLIKYLLGLKRQLMMQGIRFHPEKKDKKEKIRVEQEDQEEQQAEHQTEDDQTKTSINNIEINENKVKEGSILSNNVKEGSILSNQEKDQTQDEQKSEEGEANKMKIEIYEFWVDVKHNRAKNGIQADYIIEERLIDNPNDTILLKDQFPKIKVKYIVHKDKRKDYEMHYCIKCEMIIKIDEVFDRKIKVEWKGPSNKQGKGKTENTVKRFGFKIIDYERLLKGNPTIKPIFVF